ncbi:SVM family protein, predicted signal peptide [Candidatus Phytoplasma rubi]|uniref:SVM family protein, predicted signal peptide n=1 Tax=Candidatus Phytoplasma rubi TaxID=399025 RepID=A0ABY7BV89_9MOLU|nr:SVM family protein [Candidatus Phytoplasma rubi]WAN63261.1 SVM family protein, predicted signal peptide [Candidatus Phytoplasma rubi]
MIKLQNQFKIINICLFIFLGLLFITNNYQVMGMGNKNSNNNEISNDEEYVLYINEEFVIQNELANFKINDEKKDALLEKQKCITKAINKYNKRQNNNQLSTTYGEQPESSRRNISSAINDDDELQPMNLIKNNSKCPIDQPESSKKNDYKK